MRDPIDPTKVGYILDVRRLRALVNDPKYHDDMEVYVSLSTDLDDGSSVQMQYLDFHVIDDEPAERLVITFDAEKAREDFTSMFGNGEIN